MRIYLLKIIPKVIIFTGNNPRHRIDSIIDAFIEIVWMLFSNPCNCKPKLND
jgi:hypothetical protein